MGITDRRIGVASQNSESRAAPSRSIGPGSGTPGSRREPNLPDPQDLTADVEGGIGRRFNVVGLVTLPGAPDEHDSGAGEWSPRKVQIAVCDRRTGQLPKARRALEQ